MSRSDLSFPRGLASAAGTFTQIEHTGGVPTLVLGLLSPGHTAGDVVCARFDPADARAVAELLQAGADQVEIERRRATGEPPKRVRWTRFMGRPPAHIRLVYRPTRWGNPYKIGSTAWRPTADGRWDKGPDLVPLTREGAIDCFRWSVVNDDHMVAEIRRELAGYDLACSCSLDVPCHADVLLEIANGAGEVSGVGRAA